MPTTDDDGKFDEDTRRKEAEQARILETIFSCGAWVVMAIIVGALLIVLTR